MRELKPLQMAVDMLQRQRDDAARHLAQRRAQRTVAEQQLEQLNTYAAEIQSKWIARPSSPDAAVLHHHYQFLAKLDQAVAYQHRVLGLNDQQIAQAQGKLIEAEHQLMRFEHVLKARQTEFNQRRQRREQKNMDDMAAQTFVRRQRRQAGRAEVEWAVDLPMESVSSSTGFEVTP